MVNKNKTTKKGGFTLLEMIISIGLFSAVMVIVLTTVITIIDLNRKTQALASLTNNMNSVTDSMIRLIKSGEKDFEEGSYTGCGPGSQLSFKFYDSETIFDQDAHEYDVDFVYACEQQSIYRKLVRSDESVGSYIRMTPADVNLTFVKFDVDSECQDKVNIIMKGEAGSNKTQSEFILQTTATRRSVVGTGSCTP